MRVGLLRSMRPSRSGRSMRPGGDPVEEARVEQPRRRRHPEPEGGDGEEQALHAQRRQPDEHGGDQPGEAGQREGEQQVEPPVVRGARADGGAHGHEGDLAERHLPGPAGDDDDRHDHEREDEDHRDLQRGVGLHPVRQVRAARRRGAGSRRRGRRAPRGAAAARRAPGGPRRRPSTTTPRRSRSGSRPCAGGAGSRPRRGR